MHRRFTYEKVPYKYSVDISSRGSCLTEEPRGLQEVRTPELLGWALGPEIPIFQVAGT